MQDDYICKNCLSGKMTVFYQVDAVPVHSVLLLATKEKAITYPKRDIALGFCDTCGFISNVLFDATMHDYSAEYEATQAFSPTFNRFHRSLAQRLIEKYDLQNKKIIEIGCGQGEFLELLCQMGNNTGIGFDPAYTGASPSEVESGNTTYIADFYSEKYIDRQADFVCCKMTLEHIPDTANFVNMVRRAVGNREDTVIFFQIPNVMHILNNIAFWDIYYEHCSYFSPVSLAYLFNSNGFEVMDIWTEYDDQYLMIEARPSQGAAQPLKGMNQNIAQLKEDVTNFAQRCRERLDSWQQTLQALGQRNETAVIWGSGSKGVSFLTALNLEQQITYTIDINPRKHGTYMAGTGQEIKPPAFLQSYHADVVIVMNPVYCDEIAQDLKQLGLSPKLMPV